MNARTHIATEVRGCTTTALNIIHGSTQRACQNANKPRTVIPQGDHGRGELDAKGFEWGPGPHGQEYAGDVGPEDEAEVADECPQGIQDLEDPVAQVWKIDLFDGLGRHGGSEEQAVTAPGVQFGPR